MKKRIGFLLTISSIALLVVLNRNSFAFFNSSANSTVNVFSAAFNFPSPIPSITPLPSPSPSIFPSPSPSSGPANHVVINEIYYFVDGNHGGVNIVISGNGAGSNNSVNSANSSNCVINQSNNSNVTTNINNSSSTGGNNSNGNTGGNTTVVSGDATSSAAVTVGESNNTGNCSSNGNGQNFEWIELYNPTEGEIALKDYTLTDNSGQPVKIPGNFKIGAKKFVLLSRSNSTWSFWSIPAGVQKIPLGKSIGDGLDDGGDRIILKDKNGNTLDQVSWGSDTSVFNLIGVPQGHSLEREPDGKDTDTAADFIDRQPPAPGL